MSNDLVVIAQKEVQVAEKLSIDVDIYRALKHSLFPGAKDESIGMYLAYCRAKSYDPLKKPMHIVPINTKTGKKTPEGKDEYEMRDVIMPGINSYRIDASRTSSFYGISRTEFGPMISKKFAGSSGAIEYPEWCELIIYKKIGNDIREIPTKLYWIECYASKSSFTDEPNKMWAKRPRYMLEKCAEAACYRKGFPEETGGLPTHEEMEGRNSFDDLPGEKDVTPEKQQLTHADITEVEIDNEVLQKHLNIINNSVDSELLKIAYNDAKTFAKGNSKGINEITIAAKNRRDYIAQLNKKKPKDESLGEYGTQAAKDFFEPTTGEIK